MGQRFKTVLAVMCTSLCGLCLSTKAFGQDLPDGKGKAEFVHNCTACHRADMVTAVKKTPEDWRKSVDDMAARGTDGTKEDLDNVTLYLDKYFAIDTSAPAAATQSPAPSTSSASAAPNASGIESAKHVIAENGCLTCHRIEQQGAYTGPSLNGVGARHTTAEIRASIVSPHATLDPGNELLQATTADGKPLSGRVLSQDDHQVRMMNASGEVSTYSKPELRQFTLIHTDPMPSFEKKITGEDLDSLVRYLATLPPVPDSLAK